MKKLTSIKIIIILFLSVILISTWSCKQSDPDVDNNLPDSDTGDTTESNEYILAERDYSGRKFIMLSTSDISNFLWTDTYDGNVLNDAMYEAKLKCEVKYDIKVNLVLADGYSSGSIVDSIEQSVLAGDDNFNAAYANSVYLANRQASGIYKNLYDIPGFDFARPWWPKYSVEAMTVKNQMYLGISSISYAEFARARIIIANKDLLEDYGIEVPYDLVKNQKWTLDTLINLSKDVYSDLNGNSERDEEDRYGYMGSYWANPWTLASGMNVIEKTNDDRVLTIEINADKMSALTDKIYKWYFEEEGSYIDNNQISIFSKGNGLFVEGTVENAAVALRTSDITYAILPFPKYDENQKDYYSYTQSFAYILPNLDADDEFNGTILEALSYYGYSNIIPAYYEQTLKGKVADSPDDAAMLDIIYRTMKSTFDRCYDEYHGMQLVLNLLIPEHSRDFVSWYEANIEAARTKLEKLSNFYRENSK